MSSLEYGMNKQKQMIKWTNYNNELKTKGKLTLWLASGFQRRKLHLAVNESTNDILAVLLTGNDKKDSEVIRDLLNQIPDDFAQVSANGAYDSKNGYDAIEERNAIATTIQLKKSSVIRDHGNLISNSRLIRDEYIRHRSVHGKAILKIDTMYSKRSLAETAMFRFKIIFGGSLRSRSFKNKIAEAVLKCQILNKFKTPSIL